MTNTAPGRLDEVLNLLFWLSLRRSPGLCASRLPVSTVLKPDMQDKATGSYAEPKMTDIEIIVQKNNGQGQGLLRTMAGKAFIPYPPPVLIFFLLLFPSRWCPCVKEG